MLESLKSYIRRKQLRKHTSPVKTGFIPMASVRSVAVIVDVEDKSYDACKESVNRFFKGARADIWYFDFRRLGKEELLLTSINTTILRTDIGWYGRPDLNKIAPLLDEEDGYDILISLIPNVDFPNEFIVKASRAKFKIGVTTEMTGKPFDLVISNPEGTSNQAEMFNSIKEYLTKISC
ncbi:MAG: hypothetical protein HUJ94_05455 [Bacteroidales bacterium]|nr:hypothetical protein [Bacteroidales bacterium]